MKSTDLQHKLAHLALGETLLLPSTEVEAAFHAFPTSKERRDAAAALAVLYRCSLTVCGPAGSQILFTRHDSLEEKNSGSLA
jgi:hypothetical protein